MKYYITRCALTRGVRYLECSRSTVNAKHVLPEGWRGCIEVGLDAHLTVEAAQARFEAMRAAEIKSHEKALAELRALTFEVRPS